MHRVSVCLLCVVGWGGCAGAPSATPEQRRLGEARLVDPFLRGTEVGCAELLVEVTANFMNHVVQPAFDPSFHRRERADGDGYREIVWTNLAGDPAHAFRVAIGEPAELTERGLVEKPGAQRTVFRVVNQVRLRTFEDRRPLQIAATASGFVIVREAGGKPREVAEFAIADGVMHVR